MNGWLNYLHHELIKVIFDVLISTVMYAFVSFANLILLIPKTKVDNEI